VCSFVHRAVPRKNSAPYVILPETRKPIGSDEIAANVAKLPSQLRNSDMPGAIQTNSSSRRRGQINIPTPDPGAAVVNANCDASTVTDANVRAKWQSAMSRCHC
jgi:hypothetical protein